jgi:hypothetical protein
MSNLPIWPGSASFAPGITPMGTYDDDIDFTQEAPRVARWCAIRLGYPIQNIELVGENFFACFEEAALEYSSQVNQWNIRNNLDIVKGQPTTTNLTQKNIQGSFVQNLVTIADGYGTLANVGGNTDIKRAYVELTPNKQIYDLMTDATLAEGDLGKKIDVTRVFYEETPAISRFFDPYSVSGQGTLNLIDEFGFGSFSPAAQFILMPIFEDLLRMQAIEFNDQIRKSAHSFNIVNNKLQIFPIPTETKNLWFEYMVRSDFILNSTTIPSTSNEVSDYSNIRYNNIPFERVNDVGRQWIRKYTLALSKEVLGAIREKYSTVPIPGSEVSLDGAALRSEAQTEKENLITQLRENLEDLSRKNQFEAKATEAQQTQEMLQKIPLMIYVG